MSIVNNVERHQFELRDGNLMSRLVYRIKNDVIDLIHTEVPRELEGRGIARELTRFALDYAQTNNLVVRPTCPYIQTYLKRYPTTAKLVGST